MKNQATVRPLLTRWGEKLDQQCPLSEYPRPQLRRPHWQCLNGLWDYAIREDELQPDVWDGEILVPFSPESLLSGVGRQLLPGQTLWYRRKVCFERPTETGRLLLHFGAVDQCCTVYCNSQPVGEHAGGYWPFALDITSAACPSENTLLVRVTDASDNSNEAYGKQKLERGEIFYTAQSGIWQTVWCEWVPERYIEALRITPHWRDGVVEVACFGPDKTPLPGTVRVLEGERVVAEAELASGEVRLTLPQFKSWSPDDPFLYDLVVASGQDEVRSYFGMREFGVAAGPDGYPRLMLNGKPILHNGLLDQGYWSDGLYTPPADEAMVWELEHLKAMGFNMLRKHIKIEPLRWYYHCDRLGLLVWQDFVSGAGPYEKWRTRYAPRVGIQFNDGPKRYALHHRTDPEGRAYALRDAKRTVELLYSVPCIAVWVPFNEGWGQFDAVQMEQLVRGMDATRQVDHASGYFDQGAGDFSSWHIYYQRFRPAKNRRGRILALTEFGGYSQAVEGHTTSPEPFGYKMFETGEALGEGVASLYRREILPALRQGLGALIYTQVSDIEDEINGFFTYDRAVEKVPQKVMRQVNAEVYEAFERVAGAEASASLVSGAVR